MAEDDSEQREEPIIEVMTPEVVYSDSRNPFSRIWSRSLRIKIIGRDGFEKLDVRIPVSLLLLQSVVLHSSEELMQNLSSWLEQAGFLEGVTNIVPGISKLSPVLFSSCSVSVFLGQSN